MSPSFSIKKENFYIGNWRFWTNVLFTENAWSTASNKGCLLWELSTLYGSITIHLGLQNMFHIENNQICTLSNLFLLRPHSGCSLFSIRQLKNEIHMWWKHKLLIFTAKLFIQWKRIFYGSLYFYCRRP